MLFKKIINRRGVIYFTLFLAIIPLGLATRKYPQQFPDLVAEYGGDVFWSTMFFFLFRFFFPSTPLWKIGGYTFLFSLAIEISQLYHAAWIDQLRDSFLGSMILGSTFVWSDIACYLVGTLLGWVIGFFADKYTKGYK